MADRSAIIDRITALRARAQDEASSPNEAAAAAQRVARLMAEHEVTEAEPYRDNGSSIGNSRFDANRAAPNQTQFTAQEGIAALAEVRILWRGGEVVIYGLPADVAFALYLCELIKSASARAWKDLPKSAASPAAVARARKNFLYFFGAAVTITFLAAAEQRRATRATATGTSIVLLKETLINDHITTQLGEVKDRRFRGPCRLNKAAARAGLEAGSKISPTRPIEQDQAAEGIL